MNRMRHAILISSVATLFIGCTSTNQASCTTPDEDYSRSFSKVSSSQVSQSTKPNSYPYKAVIGTRNNDAKTVIDYGTVLKVYIAPYKDSSKSLVSGHDRYVFAKEPGFIVGADKPVKHKRTGLVTPKGSVPFMFNSEEIDKYSLTNNSKINTYIDAVNTADSNKTIIEQRLESGNAKLDAKIKRFLKEEKGE
ncbi:MAG: hypothetical protein PHE67_00815 [Campylobacterales bacterium]|nr:hypothetical protein [Campylobacterales bacterium]